MLNQYKKSIILRILTCTLMVSTTTLAYDAWPSDFDWESPDLLTEYSEFTFSTNWADDSGGGMCNYSDCRPTLTDCIFRGNVADKGGAVHNDMFCEPRLANCRFSGNRANDDGGGIYSEWVSSPTLANCIFSGNSTNGKGGGMYNEIASNPILVK